MGKRKLPPSGSAMSLTLARMLRMVRDLNAFRNVKRLIWYRNNDERELVGEHSDQLTLFAWYVCDTQFPNLNREKVLMYAQVHDLPEIKALDTPAFPDNSGRYKEEVDPRTKNEREEKAVKWLQDRWGNIWPEMLDSLHSYHRQEDEESRFIYALDKFLADLNVYEDNGRTDKRLRVTASERIAYKRPRIATFPPLLIFYDDFCRFCRDHRPEVLFEPDEMTDA